ncbi:metallophosphoesterase [Phyllobacterium ifriqiyense]|nr:DNA repair exonuclease [Phyllobacterium ifriqiyense]
MPFRFIHTADIHLDSPLRSLSLRDPDLASLIGDATRQALIAIIDLCLEEQVNALIIAGDLYDGDQTSMKTARFLATQMQRLHEAGISVYKIRGNHDALSKITQELVLPPSVKIFGARAEALELRQNGFDIAIHGLSFAKPQAPDSLLPKYKPPLPDAVNIGIMHTSLAGASGHDPYGPCNVADLHSSGFDYWALGHIHQRSQHAGQRTVIMPGMPQGRDINEAGEKTVSLVTIGDDRSISIEERLTSIAQFERLTIDVSKAVEWRDVVGGIETALVEKRTSTRSMMGGIASVPFGWVMPDSYAFPILILAGLLGGFAHIAMTLSFRHAEASLLAPFEYLAILWPILADLLLFDMPISSAFLTALPLVLAGAALAAIEGHKKRKVVSASENFATSTGKVNE